MAKIPDDIGKGFEDWARDPNEKGGFRKSADLGAVTRTWPTGKEMEGLLKKGDISDTVRTPIQFVDPAYFDQILFFIQHRDRKELNFRLRYFYEYDEVVGPLIDLHSEFPLSDFKLQCADSSIQRQYEDLRDRIELLPLLMDISKDYWLLGEVFPYGRWNESEKTWDFFSLIPPEKVELRSSYITPNPIIVLQVDDQLKKLVSSGDEVDQTIVRMMDADIVEKMKTQNYIVLPPWQVSHFAKKTSRTDLRGTSVMKRCLKPLLYKEKLRLLQFTFVDRHMFPLKLFKLGNAQTGWIPNKSHFEMLRQLLVSASNDPDFCFSQDTELLTENGWKFFDEIRPEEKLATLNQETNQIEYQLPTHWTSFDYNGPMYHFKNGSVDLLVTPNHNLWARPEDTDANGDFYPWRFVKAKDFKGSYKFQCVADWEGSLDIEQFGGPKLEAENEEVDCGSTAVLVKSKKKVKIKIGNYKIDLEDLLKLASWYVSEGCGWRSEAHKFKPLRIHIAQLADTKIGREFDAMLGRLEFPVSRYERLTSPRQIGKYYYKGKKKYNVYAIYDQSVNQFLMDNFGHGALSKKIPTWVKMLPKECLVDLLSSLVDGDGTRSNPQNVPVESYTTVSKQLARDIQEIALKIGWASSCHEIKRIGISKKQAYMVTLIDVSKRSRPRCSYPLVRKQHILKETYNGRVFCPTVPSHLVFARRNGHVVVSGQCLIFHHGLQVEYIGSKDKIENLIPHLEWCDKQIMKGLFSNEALMTGGGVTYANANVSVRVLMHRYLVFRSKLELFVNNKIFMPVAKARGYWVPDKTGNNGPSTNINGKYKILDVPKMRWSKLNLIDDTSQKQFIMRLYEKGTIPHRLIADIFDLEESDLRHQLEQEQGTVVDPMYVKARQDALSNPAVRDQVLKGVKTADWVLKAEKEEDKSKVKKSPRQTETPEVKPQPTVEESAGGTPAPGGGASPAAPGAV